MIENRKKWATYGVELNKIAVINKWKIKGKARGQIKINTQKRQKLWYFFFFRRKVVVPCNGWKAAGSKRGL